MAEVYYGAGDVDAMLQAVGVNGTVDGVTVRGALDRSSLPVFDTPGPPFVAEDIRWTVRTGSLPGLAIGVPATVDGEAFIVRDVQKVGDGALTEVELARA